MASSGNFCTLNPLTQPNSGTFSEGNLLFTHTSSAWRTTAGTHGMRTGKWYWEAYQYEGLSGNGFPVGISDIDNGTFVSTQASDYPDGSDARGGPAFSAYSNSGSYASRFHNGSETNMTFGIGAAGDLWQCALDLDNGKIWFGKNNTWDNSGNPATGSSPSYSGGQLSDSTIRTWVPITCSYNDSGSENFPQNFGQDSTFSGRITAGGNADENGFGDFKYTPPTGFLALCSGNLPVSDDIDPAQTDDNFPQKQFNAILYTGNASTNAITGLGFQPDLVWFKRRDYTGNFNQGIIDSSRGVSVGMYPDRQDVDTSFTSDFNSFDSDGFTLKAGSSANLNNSGSSFVAWCWRCAGGTTSSNSDGALTSTVQVNQEAGFSMSLYTCNGSGSSFGHGLGATPDYFMIKKRDNQARDWMGWHKDLTTPTTAYIRWNKSNAQGNDTLWDSTAHDSTKIYVNQGTTEVNSPSGDSYICYAWRSVEGYSKFGSYEGNGNSDGPFIYTGFRPRLLFLKSTETADDWIVIDTARSTSNVTNRSVSYNTQDAEVTSNRELDILSNGFKPRTSNTNLNKSGTKYIYGCWGDVPFKYNNTF